jgi:hypothetical protein
MAHEEDRSAVLVIRAWHEPGSPQDEVRARLTSTPDAEAFRWDESVARGKEEIVAAVLHWLNEFTRR